MEPISIWRTRAMSSVFVCFAVSVASAVPAFAIPAHDNCTSALNVASLPFVDALPTPTATTQPTDPLPSCGNGTENMWYRLQAGGRASVRITTEGSDYDTVISVHRGSCGAFVELGCNDDIPNGPGSSEMIVPMEPGEVVFVQVGSASGSGGNLVVGIDTADPPQYKPSGLAEVVLSSDASPLGGSFGELRTGVALTRRHVGFSSRQYGIFHRSAGGAVTTVATSGTPTPLGGVFSMFGEPSLSSTGAVVFYASVNGGAVDKGLFRYDGFAILPVVTNGAAAPGGGTFTDFGEDLVFNNNGDIVFLATTSATPVIHYDLYTMNVGAGTGALLAQIGGLHPCGGGGVIRHIGSRHRGFDVADNSLDVVFWADGSAADGILALNAGGAVTAVACDGDPAPGGGTFDRINEEPAMDQNGQVYFTARVSGGAVGSALWRAVPGGAPPVSVLTPGFLLLSGQTLATIDGDVDVSANGVLAFIADLGGSTDALVVDTPSIPGPTAVAVAGGAPGCPGGGAWVDFAMPEVASSGDVVFEATCGSGTGVFHAAPPGAVNAIADTTFATAVGPGFRATIPEINAGGDVSFRGWRKAAFVTRCNGGVCAPTNVAASVGGPLPTVPGDHIDDLDTWTFNGFSRRQAVAGDIAGASGIVRRAVFGLRPGQVSVIAAEGDPLPASPGTFDGFPQSSDLNDLSVPSASNKAVAFWAEIDGNPTATRGIFAWTRQGLGEVVFDGDVAPNGGLFSSLGSPMVRKRTIVFRASGLGFDCIYAVNRPGDPLQELVCDGDPAPAPLVGTIDFHDAPPSGTSKAIYFGADVSGGTSTECLMRWRQSGLEAVRCAGDVYWYGDYIYNLDPLSPFTYPVSELKGKGSIHLALMDFPSDVYALVAERRDRFYTLLHRFDTTGPVTGGNFRYRPETPPSMNKKTVVFSTELAHTLAADWAVVRAELY